MQDSRKAWLYATAIMLVVSFFVLVLRFQSIAIFTLDFELALVYVPTIILVGISIYLAKVGQR